MVLTAQRHMHTMLLPIAHGVPLRAGCGGSSCWCGSGRCKHAKQSPADAQLVV